VWAEVTDFAVLHAVDALAIGADPELALLSFADREDEIAGEALCSAENCGK
jgi:hypothetical protein